MQLGRFRGRVGATGALVAALAVASALVAPGSGGSVAQRHHAAGGGSLTVLESAGYAGNWATLDPAVDNGGGANQSMMDAIFGGVFELGAHNRIIKDFASGYQLRDNNRTLVIHLRPGLRFSDGQPLDAAALAFNITRDLAAPCSCKPLWSASSVTASGPVTVVIHLKAPDGAVVDQFIDSPVNWPVSPKALKQEGAKRFGLKPVGAGPFEVVSDVPSNSLVLRRNPRYWQRGRPYLSELKFESVASDEAALEALRAGSAQVYEGMVTPSLLRAYKAAGFTATKQLETSVVDVQLNTLAPPFNNPLAREALYYATDTSAIDKKLELGSSPIVQSFAAPGGLFAFTKVPGYRTYDPAKARQLVKQLGGLTFNLAAIAGNPSLAEALQAEYRAAGMQVTLGQYDVATGIGLFISKKWQAFLQTAGSFDPAAGVGLNFRFGCGAPLSGVCSQKLDTLMTDALAVHNPTLRARLYQQASAYLSKQALAPFLFPLPMWDITAKGVSGPGLTRANPAVVLGSLVQWQNVTAKR